MTPAQLQARSGAVRCGRCMHAFDGYEMLAADQGPAVAITSAPDSATIPHGAQASEAATHAAAPAQHEPHVAATSEIKAPTSAAAPIISSATFRPAPAAKLREEPPPEASTSSPVSRVLRAPTRTQLWSTGAAGLALVLAAQGVFAFRSELGARYPSVRSALTGICARVGCAVPLPQRPDLVRIEASDVHMVDANRPQLIQLTATLRNYATHDVGYPALDLVLTNVSEHALARRIFTPDEYLDESRDPNSGIPAKGEVTVALDMDTGNLNPAGFRLDLIAAPSP